MLPDVLFASFIQNDKSILKHKLIRMKAFHSSALVVLLFQQHGACCLYYCCIAMVVPVFVSVCAWTHSCKHSNDDSFYKLGWQYSVVIQKYSSNAFRYDKDMTHHSHLVEVRGPKTLGQSCLLPQFFQYSQSKLRSCNLRKCIAAKEGRGARRGVCK